MEKNYEILDWDSRFFGFTVAKIKDNALAAEGGRNVLECLRNKDVKLAFYNTKSPLESSFLENEDYEIKLVHKRVLLEKNLKKVTEIHPNISFYDGDFPDEDMIKLAQRAGTHGRFGTDKNISKKKYNQLFEEWIINSVRKKMASDVLVYKENNRILGLATIKLESDFAYMPLFAVHREHEGKGISFSLMRAVESVALQRGYTKVLGGTQDLNLKALKVYERYGIQVIGDEFIYHLWKK